MGILDSIKGRKSSSIIGLDIGTFNVKIVNLSVPASGKPRLLGLGVRTLPASAIVEKDIKDHEGVIYAVQSLAEEVAPDAREAILTLSGHKVFTDRLQISLGSKKGRLAEAVLIEAEQRIPTGTSGVAIDFHHLGKAADGKKEDVILVAARRELVEQYFYTARDAGLDPIAIDVDFFATFNAFEFNYGIPEEGVIALANIGHVLTNITFIIDGLYYTVRDVSTGARQIWDYIQSELRLTGDDLDDIIVGKFPVEDKTAFQDAVFNAAEDVKLGLDVAFSYIENVTKGRKVDKIYLSGGGATIDYLPEAISQKTEIAVEPMNPFRGLQPAEGVFSGQDPAKIGPLFVNAVGLALRGE
ncbi:MAG TPA: type IV pilus assembly protein PilM [candidate division Zixibacteria bacterium]|nr:type IV pilus assembly protein PilM [candidate division Zixibacteria bacterium]